MNHTIKDATVRRFHYDAHDQLHSHLTDFVQAYNFAKRLKTLKGLTPYEFICKAWQTQPERFILDLLHQMPGLNIKAAYRPTRSRRCRSPDRPSARRHRRRRPQRSIRVRLTETEARRAVFASALTHAETNSDIPAFPSNPAEIYHDKVKALQAALTGPAASQARETARAMIGQIIIHPPEAPGTPPGIELIGELHIILQTAGLAPNARTDQAHHQNPFSNFIS